jgi:hypothetical protein
MCEIILPYTTYWHIGGDVKEAYFTGDVADGRHQLAESEGVTDCGTGPPVQPRCEGESQQGAGGDATVSRGARPPRHVAVHTTAHHLAWSQTVSICSLQKTGSQL